MKAAWLLVLAILPWAAPGGALSPALEPTRRIAIDTDEGTWMSVDVAPDGRTLAFDLLGDIYLVSIDGGEARQVTDGFTFNTQPRFSPDGRRIAFVSDRDGSENLWIMNSDGTGPIALTHEVDKVFISPEWSPDGTFIFASRTITHRDRLVSFWRYEVEGGVGREIELADTDQKRLMALGAAFGRESEVLYFAAKALDLVTESPNIGEYQLATLDLATGEIRPASNMPRGGALRPVLSPDGRWLVYATRHDAQTALRLRDMRTGEESWLRYPATRDEQESRHPSWDLYPGSSFTPDSREIVTTLDGKLWRVEVPSGRVRPVPFHARIEKKLAPLLDAKSGFADGPTIQARQIIHPAPSPDGRKLAFGALGAVWVMDLPQGKPRRVSPEGIDAYQPNWAPDGRSLVFATWRPESGGHVMRVGVEDSDARILTRTPAHYQWPTHSPDGKRIAVVRMSRQAAVDDLLASGTQDLEPRAGPRVALHGLPSGGGESKEIAVLPYVARPHFAGSDGRIYLYFPRRASGLGGRAFGVSIVAPGLGLYSVGWDGGGWRLHVTHERFPKSMNIEEALLAPDGRSILAVGWGGHLYHCEHPDRTASLRRLAGLGGDFAGWSPRRHEVIYVLGSRVYLHDTREDKPREIQVRLEVPRARAEGSLVLRGARAITMRGDEVIERADVVIRDGRIAAVGAEGSVPIPAGASIERMDGKTIAPGFVDAHSHVLNGGIVFHPQQPWEYLANLSYGVTSAFDPSPSLAMVTLADRVASGEFRGPRYYGTGPDPQMPDADEIVDLDSARRLASRVRLRGFEGIKEYAFAGRRKRQWVAMAAAEQDLLGMTEGNGETKPAISEILDGYSTHEHYFTIYPLYRDFAELIARSGTGYNPTLLVAHGANGGEEYFYRTEDVVGDRKLREFTPPMIIDWMARRRDRRWMKGMIDEEMPLAGYAAAAGQIAAAGGRVGVGIHGQLQGLGFHWEMWALAKGMSPHAALRAATLDGARNVGLDHEIGSIEPGKVADLVVLDANPLENIRNTVAIHNVIQGGRLFDAYTLDELWPRQRSLGYQKWWPGEPRRN